MKKTVSIILSLLIAVALCACGESGGAGIPPESGVSGAEDQTASGQSEGGEETATNPDIDRIAAFVSADVDRTLPATNVFKERAYTLSREPSSSEPEAGLKLTDGVSLPIYSPLFCLGWDGGSAVSVDFDISDCENGVADLKICCHAIKEYGYSLPNYVAVKASDNGKKYVELGRIYTPADVDPAVKQTYYFAFPKAVKAKHLQVYFSSQPGEKLLCDEIFGYFYSEDGAFDNSVGSTQDDRYSISDYYSYHLNTGGSAVKADESDADYRETQNLARLSGVDVQIEHFDPFFPGHTNSPPEDIKMLTDGKRFGTDVENDYFRCYRGAGRNIVVDLGKVMAVQGCNIAFCDKYTWGISTPVVFCVDLSENGTDFVNVYSEYNQDYGKKARGDDLRECVFKKAFRARYLRLSFPTVPDNTVSSSVYIGEIEVIGRKDASGAVKAEEDHGTPYGRYPSPAEFGMHSVLFTCIGDEFGKHCTEVHVLTGETALEYLVATDENGEKCEFMDSFMFTTRGAMNSYKDRTAGFGYFLDELFYEGVNLDAAEKAAGEAASILGRESKLPVWISVNCPAAGDIFEGGEIKTLEDYNACLKWQADEAIKRFNARNYKNIFLAGFYWQHENIRAEACDKEAAKAFNDYIHSLGYKSIWAPYYSANGIWFANEIGFDITCWQPNYMFLGALASRNYSCGELARIYGIGIEIECENYPASREGLKAYREYLRAGVECGYINGVCVYYQGSIPGEYIRVLGKDDDYSKAFYSETVKFAQGDAGIDGFAPQRADLSAFNDASLKVKSGDKSAETELGDLSHVEWRFAQTPVFGYVRVDNSGRLTYTPIKGFSGTEEIKIAMFDGVDSRKLITVFVEAE